MSGFFFENLRKIWEKLIPIIFPVFFWNLHKYIPFSSNFSPLIFSADPAQCQWTCADLQRFGCPFGHFRNGRCTFSFSHFGPSNFKFKFSRVFPSGNPRPGAGRCQGLWLCQRDRAGGDQRGETHFCGQFREQQGAVAHPEPPKSADQIMEHVDFCFDQTNHRILIGVIRFRESWSNNRKILISLLTQF